MWCEAKNIFVPPRNVLRTDEDGKVHCNQCNHECIINLHTCNEKKPEQIAQGPSK